MQIPFLSGNNRNNTDPNRWKKDMHDQLESVIVYGEYDFSGEAISSVDSRIRRAVKDYDRVLAEDFAKRLFEEPEQVFLNRDRLVQQTIDAMVNFLYEVNTYLLQDKTNGDARSAFDDFYIPFVSLIRNLGNQPIDAYLFEEALSAYNSNKKAFAEKVQATKRQIAEIDEDLAESVLSTVIGECPSISQKTPFGEYDVVTSIPSRVRVRLQDSWKGDSRRFVQEYDHAANKLKIKKDLVESLANLKQDNQQDLFFNEKAREYLESARVVLRTVEYIATNYRQHGLNETIETMNEVTSVLVKGTELCESAPEDCQRQFDTMSRFDVLENEFGANFAYPATA